MKDMAAMQPGMSFYGELPDSYNLIVNTENPVIKRIIEDADKALLPSLQAHFDAISAANDASEAIRKEATDGKPNEDQQNKIKSNDEQVTHLRGEIKKDSARYAEGQPLVKQVVDLALLANGLLRGAELNNFIRRSVALL